VTDFSYIPDRFFTGATPVCPRPENQNRPSHWSFACDEQTASNHPGVLGHENLRDHPWGNRGDLLSMTLNVGYALSSLILISVFVLTLVTQLMAKTYPLLYWIVILSTSTAGTTMSDFMDRTLELGYATGSMILIAILLAIFAAWRLSGDSLNVSKVQTFRGEMFYWMAILFSNTLGTALGDYLADDSGLGFAGALLIGSTIAVVVALKYFTKISSVLLFWVAFVLTRPFGATLGDLMTKSHEGWPGLRHHRFVGGVGGDSAGDDCRRVVCAEALWQAAGCRVDLIPSRPVASQLQ
jgi:uncharacterized membrane-anchored protein